MGLGDLQMATLSFAPDLFPVGGSHLHPGPQCLSCQVRNEPLRLWLNSVEGSAFWSVKMNVAWTEPGADQRRHGRPGALRFPRHQDRTHEPTGHESAGREPAGFFNPAHSRTCRKPSVG